MLGVSGDLIEARLIRRYKRFLADVELPDGVVITAHTPNTGSMLGCAEPGSRVWLRESDNARRKYRYTWEIVEAEPGTLVGINTASTTRLVRHAIDDGIVSELQGYDESRAEVRFGSERSRIDLLLRRYEPAQYCYVEIKNVTASRQGVALFPDAVSARASKHLRELMGMVEEGHRAVIFFCVQRGDAWQVRPADEIDPEYGRTLRRAMQAGVEALAYRAEVTPAEISLTEAIPVVTS